MRTRLGRWAGEYGLLLVLAALAAGFSVATVAEQTPEGASAGEDAVRRLAPELGEGVVVVGGTGRDDAAFADAARAALEKAGAKVLAVSVGPPSAAKAALAAAKPGAVAVSRTAGRWTLFDDVAAKVPGAGSPRVVRPVSYRWPNFLKADNLLNIANQIAVIAVIAVGMTLVVITGGIDLSVGSVIALAAVTATLLIRDRAGGASASPAAMVVCSLLAVLLCGLVGLGNGIVVARFAVPPFIVTLGTMLAASGVAYLLSEGGSVYDVPDGFVWLGRGADLFGVPNAVVLTLALYVVAHLALTRTAWGRYVVAVGGNAEAARLAGVRVATVTAGVYALSGLLAGLGGVVMASQLKSGSPTYGQSYELYVIAAVVVGGTSLSGGEGNIFRTLLGALLIAVIQNGMNLTGVESYTQKVVLGAIIVGAVLADRVRRSP